MPSVRALIKFFCRYNHQSRKAIDSLVQKFGSTYSLHKVPSSLGERIATYEENMAAVRKVFANSSPNSGIGRFQDQLTRLF